MPGRLCLDVSLMGEDNLLAIPSLAAAAEAAGFDGLWSSEVTHDPFMQLALAATATQRLNLGSAIALSFTRSPMTLAYTCWDLAAMTQGRFILGLGTQVKAHNERRFSVPWSAPVPRLREVIEGLRAIWGSWRSGARLNFRGTYYKFTLMSPFFTPPQHAFAIPITIAGVNPGLCQLAGELCDGFQVHPLHSARYLDEIVRPAVAGGAEQSRRSIDELVLIASVFVVTGDDAEQTDRARGLVRQQISFYASTPSYRIVFETHGWGDVADQLSRLASRGRWAEMPQLVTDEMLNTFAIVAPPEEVGRAALKRYTGRVNRIMFYQPFIPGRDENLWRCTIESFAEQV